MTTDTMTTVNLPPCGRRILYKTAIGTVLRIICKPTGTIDINDPLTFRPRDVVESECSVCLARTDVQMQPTGRYWAREKEIVGGLSNEDVNNQIRLANLSKPRPLRLLPDGTFIYSADDGDPPDVPQGYHVGDTPWTLVPNIRPCKYLRYDDTSGRQSHVLIFCDKDHVEIKSPDYCRNCVEGEAVRVEFKYLETLLPPHKAGFDRRVRFEEDGSIVYDRDDPEPPADINGYLRDPDNDYRFISQWLPCSLRYTQIVRQARCGCINLITRCNNPEAPKFKDRVKHTHCADCTRRVVNGLQL